jgi:hypothetical protein
VCHEKLDIVPDFITVTNSHQGPIQFSIVPAFITVTNSHQEPLHAKPTTFYPQWNSVPFDG